MKVKLQNEALRTFRVLGIAFDINYFLGRWCNWNRVLLRLHVLRERAFDRYQRRLKNNA